MTLQIFWPKPGNPREGGQKGGTNGREGGGGEGGSRAKPGNQLVSIYCSCSCTDLNYNNLNISKCRERIVQQPSNSPSNIIILGTSKWYNFYYYMNI